VITRRHAYQGTTNLSWLEIGLVHESHCSCGIDTGQCCALLKCQAIVELHAERLRKCNVGGEAAARHVHDAVADPELFDSGANLCHHARAFQADLASAIVQNTKRDENILYR